MNVRVGDGLGGYMTAEKSPQHQKSPSEGKVESILRSVRNFATLSEALRILGATVLLASMSVFLLQGWNEGNDISRYLLLLGQTGLLAAAGFAMSHGLKEAKGARMFFGLALISIPANFTILGALLYSVFQWDGMLTSYPSYATWTIENLAGTSATFAGAMLVLLPVTFFCFAVMARHSAKALSLHFLLLNALLLLPIRSSFAAGSIALLGVFYALNVVSKLPRQNKALKTGEGKFALTALFIPLGIILFRSMYFYQVDSLMVAMVAMAFYLAARQASLFPGRNDRIALTLDVLSVPLATVVALSVADAFGPNIGAAFQGPLAAVVYSAMAFDLMYRTASHRIAQFAGITVSLALGLSFMLSVAAWPGADTAFLALLIGTVLLLAGAALKDRTAMFTGVVTMLTGVMFGFDAIVRLIANSGWVELAVFGGAAIALASVLDRHGVSVQIRLRKWLDSAGLRHREIALDD
ncbi:MAG: hypothetical protein QNJ14_04765 [Woeseiaceae bacterium]|nr:hypothetical protein [Woeseiaceae bacterium]